MLIIPNEEEINEALILLKEMLIEARTLYARARVAYESLNDPGGLAKVNKEGIDLLAKIQTLQEWHCKLLEMVEDADLNGIHYAGLAKLEEKDNYLHQLMERKKAQVQHNERQRT